MRILEKQRTGRPTTWGVVIGLVFALSLSAAPQIVSFGPSVRYVGIHGTYSFQVTAYGRRLRYQWWNQEIDAAAGHPIPSDLPFGVNTPQLRVADAQDTRDYNGWYWCVVTDAGTGQSAVSPRGQCVVVNIPQIVQQPESRSVVLGDIVTFNITVDVGAPVPIKYQWFFNERPIYGKKGPTLTIASATARRQGEYKCRIKTIGGTNFSESAFLTVLPAT